jgi:hypothetical protein
MNSCGIWRCRRGIVLVIVNPQGLIIASYTLMVDDRDSLVAMSNWIVRQMTYGYCVVVGDDLMTYYGQIPAYLHELGLTVFLCPVNLAADVAKFLGHRRPRAEHMAATLARMNQTAVTRKYLHKIIDDFGF